MEPVLSLVDLPASWIYLLSTKMSAEAAARARCTCQLLQKVIDATWEPEEVPPPTHTHRRSVPLTLEQVQAQMPPQVDSDNSRGSGWWDDDDWDEEGEEEKHDEFGRIKRLLSTYGPAFTRLTANQALNTLQGKPMLCWLRSSPGFDQYWLSNRHTLQGRLQWLDEVIFKDNPQTWPPEDRDDLLGYAEEPFFFYGEYQAPKALLELDLGRLELQPGPHQVYTTVGENCCVDCALLRTTESSCKEATEEEQQEFFESTTASDADDFDMFLTFGREVSDFYVFLDPSRRRFTGRLKETTAASGS